MDPGYNQWDRAQTERLKKLRRLSDEDLRRPVGEHWTVAIALAHVQYWDGLAVGALEAWLRHNLPLTPWTNGEDVVNDVRLPVWGDMPPREALEQAIQTAEVLDRIVENLSRTEARIVSAHRYPCVGRSLHRPEQLDEVDRAPGQWDVSPSVCRYREGPTAVKN